MTHSGVPLARSVPCDTKASAFTPEILTSPPLGALSGIRHGFFTRGWGDCGLRDTATRDLTCANRRRVAEHLSARYEHLLSCYQIHSSRVVTVTAPWGVDNRPEADAMVTKETGIALGILTADCVPVLFADNEAGVIGAAHAGWRGALDGILENTIAAMVALGARHAAIHAAIGPCIAQASYEVGPEFPAPFTARNPSHARFFRPAVRSGHFLFDLPAYAAARLRAAAIGPLSPAPADTCAEPERFFSYRYSCLRGEERAGSLISAIVRHANGSSAHDI